jgi:hypothetical protein
MAAVLGGGRTEVGMEMNREFGIFLELTVNRRFSQHHPFYRFNQTVNRLFAYLEADIRSSLTMIDLSLKNMIDLCSKKSITYQQKSLIYLHLCSRIP